MVHSLKKCHGTEAFSWEFGIISSECNHVDFIEFLCIMKFAYGNIINFLKTSTKYLIILKRHLKVPTHERQESVI